MAKHRAQNKDNAKAVALTKAVGNTGMVVGEDVLLSKPVDIHLPFEVEDKVHEWFVYAYEAPTSKKWLKKIGCPNQDFVLTITLKGVK